MKNKGLYILGAASAILIGVGLYLWNKSKKESGDSSTDETKTPEETKVPTETKPAEVKKDVASSIPSDKGGADSKPTTRPFQQGFKAGDKVYLKGDGATIYSYPQNKGSYVLGVITKQVSLDKPIGTFVSHAGTGFVKIKPFAWMAYDSVSNKFIKPVSGNGKTAYVNLNSLSNKPY